MKSKKAKLRRQADKLWQEVILTKDPQCEVCGKPSVQAHHAIPKSRSNTLRYNLSNGVALCQGCHMKHHTSGDIRIMGAVMENRGGDWIEYLNEETKTITKDNIKWYEEQIRRLNNEQI